MERKSFPVETKAEGDAGEFVALASVFNNVDLVGDKILPGAFAKTLKRFRDSGDPVPVVFDHQHDNIKAYIGKADPLDVQETDIGLEVHGKLDMNNDVAKAAFQLMKDRVLKAWSFAYTVPKGGQKRTKDANEISEIDLIEVGPTLKGANPEAQLQGVKSALAEAEKPDPFDGKTHSFAVYVDGKKVEESPKLEVEEADEHPATDGVEDRRAETPERQDPPAKSSDWTETENWFYEVFGR